MTTFVTYPGVTSGVTFDRVPATQFSPGANGYARFVTRKAYTPPLRMAGWLQLRDVWNGNKTPGNHDLDGLHVHVGHIGNARNYVASLVRRDSHAKVAVEYGWQGYTTLNWENAGPEFVPNRVYMFEVVWKPDKITTWVGNEVGEWTMKAKIPRGKRIPLGTVGFRLDNLIAVGDFVVGDV